MHSGSAQMMAMANSFWPFAYPLKSYDLSLHPAFMQSAYRSLPVPHVQYTQTHGQTHSPSPTQQKCDKFSIDAILNRDKCVENTNRNASPVNNEERNNTYKDYVQSEKDNEEIAKRRHQRLFESTHPYLSHTSLQEKGYLAKHLQSPYKQYAESVRSDKCEKKSSPSSESWTKQSKGKRVRTIFTPEQLERMEAEFERQQYMVGTERYYLATSLNLTEAQVKVWFQNRRIKWRKQHLEQQQAKLKSMDIYRSVESASDSESDSETYENRDVSIHAESVMDPFQSPKEARGTQ